MRAAREGGDGQGHATSPQELVRHVAAESIASEPVSSLIGGSDGVSGFGFKTNTSGLAALTSGGIALSRSFTSVI